MMLLSCEKYKIIIIKVRVFSIIYVFRLIGMNIDLVV